jgi:hypothetical protein
MVEAFTPAQNLFVISRGAGFGVAHEIALKFKETCAIHAEAFSAAEVEHGPMAIVRNGLPVLMLAAPDQSKPEVIAVAKRFAARGAYRFKSLLTRYGRRRVPSCNCSCPRPCWPPPSARARGGREGEGARASEKEEVGEIGEVLHMHVQAHAAHLEGDRDRRNGAHERIKGVDDQERINTSAGEATDRSPLLRLLAQAWDRCSSGKERDGRCERGAKALDRRVGEAQRFERAEQHDAPAGKRHHARGGTCRRLPWRATKKVREGEANDRRRKGEPKSCDRTDPRAEEKGDDEGGPNKRRCRGW